MFLVILSRFDAQPGMEDKNSFRLCSHGGKSWLY